MHMPAAGNQLLNADCFQLISALHAGQCPCRSHDTCTRLLAAYAHDFFVDIQDMNVHVLLADRSCRLPSHAVMPTIGTQRRIIHQT